jgi:AraC family carnitine catabolism transcriptional activator
VVLLDAATVGRRQSLILTFFAMNLSFFAMATYDVTFLLVPRFSMIALYGAVEPLRVANRYAGPTFSWRFVSVDGQPVAASNDIPVSVSGDLKQIGRPAMAVVSASYQPEAGLSPAMLAAVRRLAGQRVLLAGIDTGPFILAEAGVLDGHRATCHWESLPGYETDRGRMTCAGGSAAIDMMLDWISQLLGRPVAIAVADQLVHFRAAESREEARVPARARFGTDDPRLLAAIAAMEDQCEDPLTAAALASIAGVSQRQLERLFRDKLGVRPMAVYGRLRLERAERLINYSRMSLRDIALATGFSSPAEFSRGFSRHFGRPPGSLRRG